MATSFTQINAFNTGIQRKVSILDPNTNLPVSIGGNLIGFESSPQKTKITVKPIDVPFNKFKRSYEGWTGKMTVARVTGDLDAFEAAQEAAYYATGQTAYYTINEETTNDDGSIDIYQYIGAAVDMTASGDWKKDADVQITIEFEAQQRVQIQ